MKNVRKTRGMYLVLHCIYWYWILMMWITIMLRGEIQLLGTTAETVGKMFSGGRVFSSNTHHLSEGGAWAQGGWMVTNFPYKPCWWLLISNLMNRGQGKKSNRMRRRGGNGIKSQWMRERNDGFPWRNVGRGRETYADAEASWEHAGIE
jgi:hypothetical protein